MLPVPQVGVLPSWFPAELAFIGLFVLIVAVLTLNKGRWWSINALAMDEPLLVAAGVTVFVGSEWLAANLGGGRQVWLLLGAGMAVFGVYAVYSDRVDLDYIG